MTSRPTDPSVDRTGSSIEPTSYPYTTRRRVEDAAGTIRECQTQLNDFVTRTREQLQALTTLLQHCEVVTTPAATPADQPPPSAQSGDDLSGPVNAFPRDDANPHSAAEPKPAADASPSQGSDPFERIDAIKRRLAQQIQNR